MLTSNEVKQNSKPIRLRSELALPLNSVGIKTEITRTQIEACVYWSVKYVRHKLYKYNINANEFSEITTTTSIYLATCKFDTQFLTYLRRTDCRLIDICNSV
jgi:hypothetical protein